MRNPEKVLNSLSVHSKNADYKFERLYRILFNEQMFYAAYQNIYAKMGNMTKGTDGKTADQMSIPRIHKLIEALKTEAYQPHPSKRVYILKKNGKKRPLGIPSFDDKLVQEVLRMIIEAIYEGSFENTSHGFRPKRSCHTALTEIQHTFGGTTWFVEGDIKGFFDNIDHEVLISVLKERIEDERFIRLIRKFLNAGYMEGWEFHRTYSGTPQGGIISPILANIYLDKLDKYMKEYQTNFNKGERRKIPAEYQKIRYKVLALSKKLKEETNEEKRKELLKEYKAATKERNVIPYGDPMDKDYRRINYVRYADDFLIGVIGSKADCETIKDDITNYLTDKLKLQLSAEKTLITNAQQHAKFLGFEISVRQSNIAKKTSKGFRRRKFNKKIVLSISSETMLKKLQEYGAVEIKNRNGKEVWKPKSRTKLANLDAVAILLKYNTEIRGFYNYFSIANNSCFINSFYYVMRFSLYKTLAQKLKLSTSKVLNKYRKGREFSIPYTKKNGEKKSYTLYHGGFKRKVGTRLDAIDEQPIQAKTYKWSVVERLQKEHCELCGTKGEVVIHQVRTLKTLKGETRWEKKMLRMNRKTLVVCETCNNQIPKH